jgi:mannose-6-phosphate isomerase
METYPYKFVPIYKAKIWGDRSLERLFGRALPPGENIGESWELADLSEGVSVVVNGPLAGQTLTKLTRELGSRLLGGAKPEKDSRFPLLLKLLDANDILSLQVHPDEQGVREIPGAALKTECWYILESRGGYVYKGLKPGVSREQFLRAIQADRADDVVQRMDVAAGDFHYLPAGTVHALGAGVVVAEVQTPSDTTYRVTDWGRGREIHVDLSMKCIRFGQSDDTVPGAGGNTLLMTPYFAVAKYSVGKSAPHALPKGRCAALMILSAEKPANIQHSGNAESRVSVAAGDTVLLPAELKDARLVADGECTFLEVTLPEPS